jgi:hypothetical protein
VKTNDSLGCKIKLLINSVVSTGVNGTESIVVSSVKDLDGKERVLQQPIALTVSKSPLVVRYALMYVADVNSKPFENVGTTSLLNCMSDSSAPSTNSVCGSLFIGEKRVPSSEGFCCPCTLDQMLGFGSHQRSNIQCNLFTGLFGTGASIHCLRWGKIWYSLFRLNTPSLEATVHITLDSGADLSLSSQAPVSTASVNGTFNITGRLVGSFGWKREPTDWGLSYMAASPNIPGSSIVDDERFTNWDPRDPFKYGLLIPQTQIDLSGRSCDKIGVSHNAFINNQGNRCTGHVSDCLHNQIEDIWSVATRDDLIPRKLCQAIGGRFLHGDGYSLSCELAESSSDVPTSVLIEMNAMDVKIVTNVSIGVIANISSSTEIHALVQKTWVYIIVKNTGQLMSEFIVSISTCSPPSLSLPLSAHRLSIGSDESSEISIKIEDSQIVGANYSCTASLTDPDGALLDSKVFTLTIDSVETDRGAQESDGGSSDAARAGTSNTLTDACSADCSSFFSLLCFVEHLCWERLGWLLGTLGGSSLLLFLFSKLGVYSVLWRVIKGCCSGSVKTKSSAHPGPSQTPRPEQNGFNAHPNYWVSYPNPYSTLYAQSG